ncbi:DUF6378 domain-containing protein [Pyruvatibacter mobilis]|uniref:DUF6378 domain-containing protein n=1 Tax=Pyruvatibacter mobilis TaxID=1712261 RepID=UPI003BAFB89A
MNRAECIDAATAAINGPRQQDYGSARENFANIAAGWSVILGQTVTVEQVALCMVWVKAARLVNSPNHADSWIDMVGYAALGGEVSDA